MKRMNPYIIYPGTCRAAIEFYRDCLGGEIVLMQTYAESPLAAPDETSERIFNAILQADAARIMASDDQPGNPVSTGMNISLFIAIPDADEHKTIFEKLAEGGTITMPLNGTFGMLTDKFGVSWMVVNES